ncbi:hypothetical protein MJ1_0231 [Nanobdella aerobiophila]|uniref:Uncharacterized protein n=1 Tax=Nanobdella aerobiophila TaxID=2586965 RepID=A0A915WSN7_9ARCH|nr:hypothetical protein [Nanobdella aerobiophila]BBL45402.1 hypothetical protein MJ1_0231 [Nanobdella aerobiophila]
MYESFEYIEEGIIYCKVKSILKDKVIFDINSKEYSFDKTIDMNYLKEGDYVRFYIKDNKIIYIETISKEFYDRMYYIISQLYN